MSATEPARHALYAQLERMLGAEHADTLMTYLPHHRSDEAATKADIADLKAATNADIADLKTRFDRLEDIVRDQQKFYVGTIVASMVALTAVFSFVVGVVG
jgi:hypothetical protein